LIELDLQTVQDRNLTDILMGTIEIMIKYILSFEKKIFLAVRYLCCSVYIIFAVKEKFLTHRATIYARSGINEIYAWIFKN
jgi:hypothetical protein